MAGNRLVFGQKDGGQLYVQQDARSDSNVERDLDNANGVYTVGIITPQIQPAGPAGLVHFRRVTVRLWKSLGINDVDFDIEVYVDGDMKIDPQSPRQFFASTDADKNVTIPAAGVTEENYEVSLDAVGTSIYVRILLDVDHSNVNDIRFESIDAHGRIIRESESRTPNA
mgnify:CR=1 FL=1